MILQVGWKAMEMDVEMDKWLGVVFFSSSMVGFLRIPGLSGEFTQKSSKEISTCTYVHHEVSPRFPCYICYPPPVNERNRQCETNMETPLIWLSNTQWRLPDSNSPPIHLLADLGMTSGFILLMATRNPGVKTSWGWWAIPWFTTGFMTIPGGWPWDFWTINSMLEIC